MVNLANINISTNNSRFLSNKRDWDKRRILEQDVETVARVKGIQNDLYPDLFFSVSRFSLKGVYLVNATPGRKRVFQTERDLKESRRKENGT